MPAPLTGQVAVTGSAQQLDSTRLTIGCTAFAIKAPSTNVNVVYIGKSGVTSASGYPLAPGEEFEYMRQIDQIISTLQLTPGDFFAVGTSPDVVAWIASG